MWASILPTVTYQVVQYTYDNYKNEYKYYHGHASFGSPEFQFNNMVISGETIVTEFYDGEGNGLWDPAEKRTGNASDCEIYLEDSDGGYCDNGNRKWDDEEIYADENQNGQWDEGEYFIDSADDIPEVDTFYYEVFTFSDSFTDLQKEITSA